MSSLIVYASDLYDWGIGVGLCSSVIPYVTDQRATARLPRATFALMLALLPAARTIIGFIVSDRFLI